MKPDSIDRQGDVSATAGLGRAAALKLAEAGAAVIVVGRNAQRGAETVARAEAHVKSSRPGIA
jgi:NAD(P)-dependent dehydrogenase (short-subunit alcohol dehydrogenase family)